MRSPRVLAVDIGASHVACGVFTAGATGRLVLQQFAVENHSSDPSHEGRWSTDIAQSLGAIATRNKLGGSSAIAVPGHLALTKFIKTPSVAKEKRAKIIGFEAAENIPYPLAEVVWDYLAVADDGFDLEVMLTAAKFEAMQTLCTATDSAGFPASRAVPAALALQKAFRYNHPEIRECVLVANIGARSTNLLLIEGDRFYVRTLSLAGNSVTQAIADELRIDFSAAETLKIQVLGGHSDLPQGSPSRAAVQRASSAFNAKLGLEIMRSSVNLRRQSGGEAPTALYLTGGGSQIIELPATLADKLKIGVHRYVALRNVDLSANARAAGAEGAASVLADLVGLATLLVNKQEEEASLLPPSVTEAIAFRKQQPVYIAAAALVVLAFAPPIFYFNEVAEAKLAMVSRVDGQLMPLRSIQTRNEENLRQIEELKKQITAYRAAYDTKSNWINFFTDLQNRLVKIEDVWLDKLQVVRPELGGADAPPPEPPPPPADGSAPAAPVAPPLRLTLSGRLLDVANPQSKVSTQARQRVQELLASFTGSKFITSVENEKFDNRQNGLLQFDFTLVINPKKTL